MFYPSWVTCAVIDSPTGAIASSLGGNSISPTPAVLETAELSLNPRSSAHQLFAGACCDAGWYHAATGNGCPQGAWAPGDYLWRSNTHTRICFSVMCEFSQSLGLCDKGSVCLLRHQDRFWACCNHGASAPHSHFVEHLRSVIVQTSQSLSCLLPWWGRQSHMRALDISV